MLMRMLIFLFAPFAALAIANAAESDSRSMCESLDRPNIDCSCVSNRLDIYAKAAPSKEGADVVRQAYLNSIGADHRYGEAMQALQSNPMNYMRLEEALAPLGGLPTTVEEFEGGCVIPQAPARSFEPKAEKAVSDYIAGCTQSTGNERYCTCEATLKRERVSEAGFEAYYRSFTQYDDENQSMADMDAARAEAMSMSPEDYEALSTQAGTAIRGNEETDAAICSAALWADEEPGSPQAVRARGGFDASTLAGMPQGNGKTGSASTSTYSAVEILEMGCAADGNSAAYCDCYINDYKQQVAPMMPDDQTAIAWALLANASGLPQSDYLELTQSIPEDKHRAAVMLSVRTPTLGESCSQSADASSDRLSGSPRDRMMSMCVEENESEELCACMVDQMESKLSPDEFELVVDLREAEYRGEDDPLETVAEERGLTKDQAEQALALNRSMMGGMMGMDMMACVGGMGGMPDMSPWQQ